MVKLLFIISFLISSASFAHPTSYKYALAVMTWNQSFLSDSWVNYSFASDAAIAARATRMQMPEGEFAAYFPQINYLVKRWNNPESQANIYAYAGYGGARFKEINGNAGLVGIEADAESRKWFVLGRWESMYSNLADPFHKAEFRLGVAPYEAEFNEIASWFMVQAQYHPGLTQKFVITPLYRMFYKSVLWETGVSTKGDWMLNFMFHF